MRRAGVIAFLVAPPIILGGWIVHRTLESVNTGPELVVLAATLIWFVAFYRAVAGPRHEMATRRADRRTQTSIRRALDRGELELNYQPQIDLRTGRPYAVEALLRWRNGRDLVTPDRFLPAVENSDLIGPLTRWVLNEAIEQAAGWQRNGTPIAVGVNLSARNLRDPSIADDIERILSLHGLRPELLTLEVTETTVLDEPERARSVLDAIGELGVSLSVDDFGVGHSSLLRLSIFPFDEIKIDQSFVRRLPGDGRAFVEGVIRLATDLDIHIVAEGVERPESLDELQAFGCHAAQGFLFARALPAAEVGPWCCAHSDTTWARHEASISIPPDYERVSEVRELIEVHAAKAGMRGADLWDVRIAATEGVANAIEHGTRSEDGLIHVRVAEIRGDLLVEIIGGGREPGSAAPPRKHPGGRGITIMNETMDLVRLTHGRDGNVIRMTKALPRRSSIEPTLEPTLHR